MITQTRATAGIWLSLNGVKLYMDPGPGALVWALKRGIDTNKLDGIILTHKHLDHSGDINVMIEAMTHGGRIKKGIVYAPQSALYEDGVICNYLREFPEEIKILKENSTYNIKNLFFKTGLPLDHNMENYGIKFQVNKKTLSFISDTKYRPDIIASYISDIMVLNVLTLERKPHIFHLAVPDIYKIINIAKPQTIILTHLGTKLIEKKPWEIAKNISQDTGVNVICAYDGMEFILD